MKSPDWSKYKLHPRVCPLCASVRAPSVRRPDGLDVAHCSLCGLWYLDKVPSCGDITSVYAQYWSRIRPRDLSEEQAHKMLEACERTIYEQKTFRIRALTGGLEGKTLLDIGCGLGAFLLLAKKAGATVLGQDISQQAVIFGKERLHLSVLSCPVQDLPSVIDPVDIVVMYDVIEHLTDPLSYIHSASKLLRLGGLLVIHTPNGGQASNLKTDAAEWVGFKVDLEHLQYFSTKSMLKLCEEGDWIIEHLETCGYPSYTSIPSDSEEIERAANEPLVRLRAYLRMKKTYRSLTGIYSRMCSNHQDTDERANDWNQMLGSYHLFCILRKAK